MPATIVEIGKSTYTLNFTVNSLCTYEDTFDQDVSTYLRKPTINNLRGVLWAGLLDGKPEITLEETGKIMDDYLKEGKTTSDFYNLLTSALVDSGFFTKSGNKKKSPTKTKKGQIEG